MAEPSVRDEMEQGALRRARDRIDSLHEFASQVEDEERNGDLGALLSAAAIAESIFAVAVMLEGRGHATIENT